TLRVVERNGPSSCHPASRTPGSSNRVGCSGSCAAALVLFALQRVGGETGRDDRIAAREPGPGEKEEPGKEQGNPYLRDLNHRTLSIVDRRDHFEVTLEPQT